LYVRETVPEVTVYRLSLRAVLPYDTYMDNVLCHLGAPRQSKPASLAEYGKLREQMIQRDWVSLPEVDFVRAVTEQGCPFYSALMHGRDLMELQYEKLVWRTQSLVGLDFDVCEVSGDDMRKHFQYLGLQPWLGYFTFSNDPANSGQSYRLLWRVDTDLNTTYDECARALKKMRALTNNLADKHAANPTRMWQGTRSGFFHYDANGVRLNLKELSNA
jgi:hypothetical protein